MLRSGFFSSKNHDRLYYNSDLSRLFNSLIIDGVFQNVGNKFIARPGTGMEVIIPSGLAYFNSTWIFNDTDYVVSINAAPIVAGFSRVDGIFLKMEAEDDLDERENTIYYMAGVPASSNPQRPVPTILNNEKYVPICYVTVSVNNTSISAAKITNMVGTSSCPFVSGILNTINADELFTQWAAQFNEWMSDNDTAYQTWKQTHEGDFDTWSEDRKDAFDAWFANIQHILDGDVAGHLQNEIDAIIADALITENEL